MQKAEVSEIAVTDKEGEFEEVVTRTDIASSIVADLVTGGKRD